jgi:hypothetical protein
MRIKKRAGFARCLGIVLTGMGCFAAAMTGTDAQTNSAPSETDLATQEKEACTRNLKVIYAAIQAYQLDHKDIPNWLSDLVPDYLSDANVLICPVCQRTGKVETQRLADPKMPSSYLFEFCPVPLGTEAPNAPTKTRRDWKRRQMGLVGSVVPIVRCRHHTPVLNLAFDGNIYESPSAWEILLTNRFNTSDLMPGRIFGESSSEQGAPQPAVALHFPSRDPDARKQLLDLSGFYNGMLTESWHGNRGNDLRSLPSGVQTLSGVDFDIRGVVQLANKSSTKWPREVKGIPVGLKCRRLHFLHAAGWGKPKDDGKQIGSYIAHFATYQIRLEIPIYYGRSVRDWHIQAGETAADKELKVAWTGSNELTRGRDSLRLFLTTWENLVPDIEIETLDYVSAMADPAPFLVAITAE